MPAIEILCSLQDVVRMGILIPAYLQGKLASEIMTVEIPSRYVYCDDALEHSLRGGNACHGDTVKDE